MAEEIRDISLSKKKSFTIDGDLNRTIQLDTSDMNILVRLEETYPDIRKLALDATQRISSVPVITGEDDEDAEKTVTQMVDILKEIDNDMRKKVDYVFASKVSDICVPTGNMFDPVGGEFRFEHLIDVLTRLYAGDITGEFKKMQERVKKHTEKYINKRNKK